jgi:hypothetical protein
MAQILRKSWTNPSTAVARNESVGFEVAKVEIWDLTTPNRFEWTADMADDSYFTLGTLAYTTSNGVTPLSQNTRVGAAISGFTNASPGVITVDDTATFGFAAGDTIKVSGLADDGAAANSLNGTFTVASVTATTITLNEATNSGFSAYVSGGFAVRVSDTNGVSIPIENQAIRGVTLGTGCVGANSASMVAIFYGEEPVV